jgi:hypothetical protein
MPLSEGASTHKIMFQELKDETNLGKKHTVFQINWDKAHS